MLTSRAKASIDITIVGVGLPSYSLMLTLLDSIAAGAGGLLMLDGVEVNHLNVPQDRLLDWFFNPILVLKEQIKVFGEDYSFGTDTRRMETWDNGSIVPGDALRTAQIQGISRRLMGITRSISKLPTYRRKIQPCGENFSRLFFREEQFNRIHVSEINYFSRTCIG